MPALNFNSAFCEEFEAWNAHCCQADKSQVGLDIVRLGETGKIFFKKEGVAESIFEGVNVKQYKEIFFSQLKSFSLPFQDFINKHFHQGGELYAGIRYVDVMLLSSIGFQAIGKTREFVFEQEGNQLIVEEVFRVKGLMFSPLHDHSFYFDPELKKEVVFDLSED